MQRRVAVLPAQPRKLHDDRYRRAVPEGSVTMKDSAAVAIALAHIDAWSRHDWDKTRELLAPDVHALVASTQPQFGGSEFAGIDNYMARKTKGAQLVEPGSVEVLSTIGDHTGALVTIAFRIRLGP